MTNLQELQIGHTALATVDLSGLINLKGLFIKDSPLAKIDGLAALTNLQQLHIMNTALATVDLSGLINLQDLTISDDTALLNIYGLENLSHLSYFKVDGPYASAAVARCAWLPELRWVQLESRPELREAAHPIAGLRKQQNLPYVDFSFLPVKPNEKSEK